MDARAFLTMLWGDVPQSDGPFVQVWDLGSRKSGYYASAAGVAVDGQADVFTGVCLSLDRLGPGRRARADQVAAMAGLWLDLDVGPNGCPTRNDAFALASAYERPTIIVSSGTGLHAWYLFEQPWVFGTKSERARAGIIAQQWVALHQQEAARHGWHIDSVGDLARILRLPGTLNGKGDKPLPVMVLDAHLTAEQRPRYTYSALALHLRDMPIAPARPALGAVAAVPGDASGFADKLAVMLENSPEFAARWEHHAPPADDSLSAYDLSLCSIAAPAFNDAELRAMIVAHRERWGDEYDAREGRRAGYSVDKAQRAKYLDDTIAKARAVRERDEAGRRLADMGRRAA